MLQPEVLVEEVVKRIRASGVTASQLRKVGIPAMTAYRMVGTEPGPVRADAAIKAAPLVGLEVKLEEIEGE